MVISAWAALTGPIEAAIAATSGTAAYLQIVHFIFVPIFHRDRPPARQTGD
jgi:hypothetical protein